MNSPLKLLILLLVLGCLSACGGGSSGGTLIPEPAPTDSPSDPDPDPDPDPEPEPEPTEPPITAPLNQAPSPVDDLVTIEEDGSLSSFNVLANDSDPDGDVLRIVNASSTEGAISFSSIGTVNYIPDANFNGVVAVNVIVTDGELTASSTLEIIVTAVNDEPLLRDDYYSVDEGSSGNTFGVLENDEDLEGGRLSLVSASSEEGSVVVDGSVVVYTPAPDFVGTDIISYETTDADGGLTMAFATVEVLAAEGEEFNIRWQNPNDRIDGVSFDSAEISGYQIELRNVETEVVETYEIGRDDAVSTSDSEVEYLLTGLDAGYFEFSVQVVDLDGKLSEPYETFPVRVGG